MTVTARRSLAQAELFDERAVALQVGALQIGQKAAPAADQHQQPAARVVVLALPAQVLGEVVDALGQQRDLHLRGARVPLARAKGGSDLALALTGYRSHRRENASRRPESAKAAGRRPA